MARRRRAVRRELVTDARYGNDLVARLINNMMRCGKRSTAERIVYEALDTVQERSKGESPVDVFGKALANIRPQLEVRSRRVGGATYQVPVEVRHDRQVALGLRWIIGFAHGRRGVPMSKALASEIMDAYAGQGSAVKKRDDTHKMAQANKAFAHYRW